MSHNDSNPMEKIGLRGGLEFAITDLDGNVLQHGTGENIVVFKGRAWALQKLFSTGMVSTDLMSWLAIGCGSGSNSTATTKMDSYLTSWTFNNTGTYFTTSTNDTSYVEGRVSVDAANLTSASLTNPGILEFALWNQSSNAGTMFCRFTTSAITCTNTNQLYITYRVSN